MIDRLPGEYALDALFEPAPYAEGRWLVAERADLEDLTSKHRSAIAVDIDNQPVSWPSRPGRSGTRRSGTRRCGLRGRMSGGRGRHLIRSVPNFATAFQGYRSKSALVVALASWPFLTHCRPSRRPPSDETDRPARNPSRERNADAGAGATASWP